VAFAKLKGRLSRQEMILLLDNRAALLGLVATQARALPPTLLQMRSEGIEQDSCYTTAEICNCLGDCNSAFNECDDEMEGLINDCETGGQEIPPSEANNPSFCRSFYEAGYGFDCWMDDFNCANQCI
jgi:hypothetical protein